MHALRPFALLAAALALIAGAPAASAQTVLTMSSWVPPTHSLTIAQNEWCELVAKNSSNKIKCNLLPRAVANPPGTFDAIKNGLADVSFTVHGYTPGRFVLTQMAEFPFLGDSAEPLYLSMGYRTVGVIPGYCLDVEKRRLYSTTLMYKAL